MFHKVVDDLIVVQIQELAKLQIEEAKIGDAQTAIRNSDTATARAFRNQLTADGLVLRVQIVDTQYRIQKLKEYTQKNF